MSNDSAIRYCSVGDDLRPVYDDMGYVVVSGVIDPAVIGALLREYAGRVVPSRTRYFRQNTNRYERNVLNRHGHVQQSFLDIHDYADQPAFSGMARRIFQDPRLLACLASATGRGRSTLMQSMLFDQNVGTPAHQDWWYLDSRPAGQLIAAWIALEDIHPDAGRFYLIPRTMHLHPLEGRPDKPHSDWLVEMAAYADAHRDRMHVPEMRAGDVILWNSRTIHGSLPTVDPRHSRKSLTAHFLPDGCGFGNLFKDKPNIRMSVVDGLTFYRNQPDYSFMNDMKARVKNYVYNKPALIRALRTLQR